MKAFRLIKRAYAADAFSGEGAALYGGRWNSVGTRVVYASSSISLATLEILVNAGYLDTLAGIPFAVFEIEFEEGMCVMLGEKDLPEFWKSYPPGHPTSSVGDDWVARGASPVLGVPSAVVPMEHNFLINPLHPDYPSLKVSGPFEYSMDLRLTAGI